MLSLSLLWIKTIKLAKKAHSRCRSSVGKVASEDEISAGFYWKQNRFVCQWLSQFITVSDEGLWLVERSWWWPLIGWWWVMDTSWAVPSMPTCQHSDWFPSTLRDEADMVLTNQRPEEAHSDQWEARKQHLWRWQKWDHGQDSWDGKWHIGTSETDWDSPTFTLNPSVYSHTLFCNQTRATLFTWWWLPSDLGLLTDRQFL